MKVLYYGCRYFSPNLGRWVSRDPAAERYALMLYLAFGNLAISHVDPIGLFDWQPALESTATLCIATRGLGTLAMAGVGIDASSRIVEGMTKLAAAIEDNPETTEQVRGAPYSMDAIGKIALSKMLGEDPVKIADLIVSSVELLNGATEATELTKYVTSMETANQLQELNDASHY